MENKKQIIEKMINLGGKEWKKNDNNRIYFNDISNIIGFEYSCYKSGNINSAKINGKPISNSKANEIINAINSGKFWYDVKSNEFKSNYYCKNFDLHRMFIDGINK